ncbi:thermonuclease family protein [Pelagerythrobacter aerophilus]|uniref:thermonuclease family protein n=1 Tax=Pelagerythrobacter aerophilus TaxID=2306995 RepID=UPI001E3445C6|nr:thermonuclease family protein [Pelagerythrobacter aerophilus]
MRRKWRNQHAPISGTHLSNKAFWTVTAIMSASVFGAIFLWDGSPSAATPDDPDAFSCSAPYIHDGDNIRCKEIGRGRLYGIDAPEMPGACRPGRRCTPGDPIASRDHLRSLVASGNVRCRRIETDRYERAILQCWANGIDLACAQVKAGHAVERYGNLRCS